ncbi:MAG: ImmA/IrrE family metallo-endopeptidase [Dehalococcoides mccartyi]|uniref:ImmA/IrrE family metallo-endopeptidase n=1 Tax=Dehalococcoides mccartyi TaxID=61435 RepID=UPI0030F5F496
MAEVGYCSCVGTPYVTTPWESASFPRKVRQKQEHAADKFAAHFLMPDVELQKMKGKGIKDVAQYFGIPEEMVKLRLTMFGIATDDDS